MAGIMHSGGQAYSTDPEWYTEPHQIKDKPVEVLEAVRANADKTYMTCGGHKMAARMERVSRLIGAELRGRGVQTPHGVVG